MYNHSHDVGMTRERESKLVFYAQSTGKVISERERHRERETERERQRQRERERETETETERACVYFIAVLDSFFLTKLK